MRIFFDAGVQYNEDGDLIITENEYLEIKRLKDLKAVYRNDFDEFKNLKSEVQYCQKLVDQCRQRLIQGENVVVCKGLSYQNVFNLRAVSNIQSY